MEYINSVEAQILVWIQNYIRTGVLTPGMKFASFVNNVGILSMITVVALLCMKKYRVVGACAAISLLIEFVMTNVIIKPIVNRERPFVHELSLKLLGTRPKDASFPSGHTGAAFSVAFVMFFMLPRKAGIIALICASLIAFSRLYLGAHYPTDVAAGVIIAFVCARISRYICDKINKAREGKANA